MPIYVQGPTVTGSNTGDQIAATVPNTPSGNIAATNVQAALNELDTEKASTAYADAKVADAINNGTLTIAPSQNAVFDALALKQNLPTLDNQTGTTYTFTLLDFDNNPVVANNAAASTYTIPQASAVAIPVGYETELTNKGAGAVTLVKQGSDVIMGNTLVNQNAQVRIRKIAESAGVSTFVIFGGTAVVPEVINGSTVGTIVNQAYDIAVRMPFGGTIMGITTKSTTTAVAGTYTVAISGTNVTGLTTVANGASGVRTNTAATSANTFVTGDYITITLAGATITDLFWSLEYTRVY